MPMSRRALSITTLTLALSLASVASSGASTGPARGGVGDAWGPVYVAPKVVHVVHHAVRAPRMARAHHHHQP